MPPRSARRPLSTGPLDGLVAVLTLATLELVRGSGPLIDTAFSGGGPVAAARAALLTYAAPGLVAVLLLAGTRRVARRGPTAQPSALLPSALLPSALLPGTVLLAVLRLGVQGVRGEARFLLGLAAVAVALAVLALAVAVLAGRPGGGVRAAAAVVGGAAGGVGLQLALGTWDAPWRYSPLGWTVAGVLAAALVLLGVLTVAEPAAASDQRAAPARPVGRLWALGPALALAAMMLANPAFAAAQSGQPLAVAGPVLGLGLLGASVLLGRPSREAARSWRGSVAAAGGLTGGVAVALGLTGSTPTRAAVVLLALLTAQAGGAVLLGRALVPRPDLPDRGGDAVDGGRRVLAPCAAGAAVAGLCTIAPLLVHQLDYDVPLGFPNELVLVVTALALGAAGLRTGGVPPRSGRHRTSGTVLVGAAALLVLGSAVAGLGWYRLQGAAEATAYTGRVVSWNLHYGVTPDGAVDLEAVARTLEAQDPDVVLLQEVSRGWVQGGGADMATWLSQRLGRPFAFGPAADGRFGNVILARGGLTGVQVQRLPYGAGPQQRSALTAVTRVGTSSATVTSLHLQHRPAGSATRVAEVEAFLDAAGPPAPPPGRRPWLVGGDLNATPGRPEVRLLARAGFVSAVDAVGDRAALTDPSTGPTRRIDWVFGRDLGFTSAAVLAGVELSDHLPLVVEVAR